MIYLKTFSDLRCTELKTWTSLSISHFEFCSAQAKRKKYIELNLGNKYWVRIPLTWHLGEELGLYRILIWPDIRPPDIRPIILPDTGYPAGNPAWPDTGYPAK